MAAIENLMKRWGFVRLSRYGLVLTPEGRIMSLRPEVLDDGLGGKIVGWGDQDLAAAELARWEAPAATKAVAIPVAMPNPKAVRVSPPVAASTISPLIQPRVAPPAIPAAAVRPVPPVIAAPHVAPAAEPEEDEWEWEIALARARAASEEAVIVARPSRSSRRMRADTVPPPAFLPSKTAMGVAPPQPSRPKFVEAKTLPMETVASRPSAPRDPITTGEWPKTEPLGNIDYDDKTNPMADVVRVVRLHQAAKPIAKIPAKDTPPPAPRAHARAASPSTVIPIPKLPRLDGRALEPVVRTRFPQATPVPARTTERPFVVPPPPVRPAEDDKTSPGMLAVPAAQVVALPRIPSIVKRAR